MPKDRINPPRQDCRRLRRSRRGGRRRRLRYGRRRWRRRWRGRWRRRTRSRRRWRGWWCDRSRYGGRRQLRRRRNLPVVRIELLRQGITSQPARRKLIAQLDSMNVTDAELAISQLRNRADGAPLDDEVANRRVLRGAGIGCGNVSTLRRLPRSGCRRNRLTRRRHRRSRCLCHGWWRSLWRACVCCKVRRQRLSRYGGKGASSAAGGRKAADPTRSHGYLHSGRSASVSPHTAFGRR